MDMVQLTQFFKWMTIINVVILVLTSVLVMLLKNVLRRKHSKMFGISEEYVAVATYCYVGVFKLLVLVFNIVPYIALSIIA